MTTHYHRIFLGLAIAAACSLPGLTFAQTATVGASSQTQIQTLLAEIQALQQQLQQMHTGTAVTTSASGSLGSAPTATGGSASDVCFTLAANLSQGSTGSEVTLLQQALAKNPTIYPQGSVTGYFGPATAAAVGRLQVQYGIATGSSIGFVGPKTRAFFSNWCHSSSLTGINPGTIMRVNPPSQLIAPTLLNAPVGTVVPPYASTTPTTQPSPQNTILPAYTGPMQPQGSNSQPSSSQI